MSKTWVSCQLPIEIARQVQPGTQLFFRNVADGQLRVMVSPPFDGAGWHLSISHAVREAGHVHPRPGRYPTWDEIVEARYALMPDAITVGILLPPKKQYVNIHPTTFHLHQVPGEGDSG